MLEDLLLSWNPKFQARKNEVQFNVNQILFNEQFESKGILERVGAAHAILTPHDMRISFHRVEGIKYSDDKELQEMVQVASEMAYDDTHAMLMKPECRQCKQRKRCNPSAYYAIYRLSKLYALMKIEGKNICHRIKRSSQLERYFAGTAAKLSYRLSDYLRMSNLLIADKVIEVAREAVVITDPQGNIVKVNDSFTRITGYTKAEAIGQNPRILQSGKHPKEFYQLFWQQLSAKGYWIGEFSNKTKQGKEYIQRGSITAIKDQDGELVWYAALMEDVTILKEQAATLSRMNTFDSLTGLPNRSKLQEDFVAFLSHQHGERRQVAVILIDLDDFKHINDGLGHNFGDEVLKAVSEKLNKVIGDDGLLYRFGGDEFVLVTEYHPQETVGLVERISRTVKRQFYVQLKPVSLSCSIGIALSNDETENVEQLLSRADIAMYWAKDNNRASFAFASESLQQQAYESLQLKSALTQAIEQHQLFLAFQPKLDIQRKTVASCEALVRWHHPTEGMIAPDRFIPVAERSGQIVQLDFWVFEAVLRQMALWRQQGNPLLPVAVNISLPTFTKANFVEEVESLLRTYQLDGKYIEFEITERVALGNIDKTQLVMSSLIKLGISIAMDDFGTGYSSLAYLHTLPISTLKIDRAFVQTIDADVTKQGITAAIVAMAKALKINTVAEGVETQLELNYLTRVGCDQFQGYLFAKPMPAEAFADECLTNMNSVSRH